jgi:hypothetical protein
MSELKRGYTNLKMMKCQTSVFKTKTQIQRFFFENLIAKYYSVSTTSYYLSKTSFMHDFMFLLAQSLKASLYALLFTIKIKNI